MEKLVRKYRKAKGFTLVELLVVIIIIGILAGMMMLSTGSATDKAEATKIVSDMRNIKSASLMYFADNNVWPVEGATTYTSLDKYLDQSMKDKYQVVSMDLNGGLTVATVDGYSKMTEGVRDKLKGMAADAGLYSARTCANNEAYAGTGRVYMVIRRAD